MILGYTGVCIMAMATQLEFYTAIECSLLKKIAIPLTIMELDDSETRNVNNYPDRRKSCSQGHQQEKWHVIYDNLQAKDLFFVHLIISPFSDFYGAIHVFLLLFVLSCCIYAQCFG